MVLIQVFLVFTIIAALIAVEAPSALSSIISLGAVGFGLSIAFLWLGAPDIAITQVVVEIITLVILIRATIGKGVTEIRGNESKPLLIGSLILFGLGSAFFANYLSAFPEFGKSAMDVFSDTPSQFYLKYGLEKAGGSNIVNDILLDFRAYDTLGEATVLFTAILGAITLLGKNVFIGKGGNE
ncbi:MAG: hydrogen gas-evolving membrane-bound hydrogenase subunit E [Candidatus Bipolaricaulia bacterium]